MNWRIRNTPNAPAANGRITAAYVLTSPSLLISTNSGTSVTLPGTISVASTRPNTLLRPAKRSFASA